MSKIGQAFSKMYDEQRGNIAHLLCRTSAFVEMASKLRETLNGGDYRVVIPQDMLQKLKNGTAHFGQGASGGFSANVHDAKTGKIIGQIGLEQAPPELISSLSQIATQKALADIAQHPNKRS